MNMLDQIATLVWANSGNTDLAEKLAAARLFSDLWQKLSTDNEIDSLRNETILKIANFVKENPNASKEKLTEALGQYISEFASSVEKL